MFSLKDTLHVTPVVGPIFGYAWLTPLVFIGAGLLLGLLFEKIILVRLHKFAERTHWKGDEIVIQGLRGLTTLWFVLLGMYGALLNFAMPVNVYDIARKLLVVLFIISATVALAKIVSGLVVMAGVEAENKNVKTASILKIVARIVVFTIGFLIILQSLGVSITPLLTALGVGGLAVALALQGTLANLFAGIQIIAAREIRPGDFIKLQSGEEGYVEDITWRITSIRMLSNNMIIVPNDKLANVIVTNFYSPSRELAVLVNLSVAYGSDLTIVERLTIEVAREIQKSVTGAVREFEPFIRYNDFGDSGIGFTVILRGNEFVDQYLIKHEFTKALQARYDKEGIIIPFPQRDVHITGEK